MGKAQLYLIKRTRKKDGQMMHIFEDACQTICYSFVILFGANVKPKKILTCHQIRLKGRGIMKRKQHVQPLLSVWNKRLLSAIARYA